MVCVCSLQVEYFLRVGYYNTALKLAEHAEIEDLTNIDLFMMSKAVEESLVNRETGPCLNWCYENKSKLRKLKVIIDIHSMPKAIWAQLFKTYDVVS